MPSSGFAKPSKANLGRSRFVPKTETVKIAYTGLGGAYPISIPKVQSFPGICMTRIPQAARLYHVPRHAYPTDFSVWVVNLFADETTITDLRQRFPDAKIIAQVDTLP